MDFVDSRARVGRIEDGRLVDPYDDGALLESDAKADEGTWIVVHGDGSLETLAEAGSARASLWQIAAERELRPTYPQAVLDETRRWQARPGIDDPDLDDLTHLPFVTIDEPHSKDLDQAVFVEPTGDGWTVWYAIADAAHFVTPAGPGEALFAESLERGSTFYLPGLVFPMLPRALSEGLVSINPDVDRRALVFRVEVGGDGEVRDHEIRRGRVRSRCKTSYQAVQKYYDEGDVPESHGATPDDVARSLDALRAVGEARIGRAAERDVVQVQRQEISVGLEGASGLRFVAMADPRYDAERYNEQISLLCNVVGARFLADGEGDADRVQGVFRFHTPPDEYRLAKLRRQIDALVQHHARSPGVAPHVDTHSWSWRRGEESLADYLARLPRSGQGTGSTDDPAARLRAALHRQALLAGGRAGFAPVPGVHHGIGAEAYARFTAPMREVVGVFVHKEAWEKLGLVKPRPDRDDETLRDQVMSAADRSRQLQRRLDHDTNRLVLDQLFGDDAARTEPPPRRGTVLGVDRSKTHVQLDDPPIDVKVYHRHLAEQLGRPVEAGYDGVSLRTGRRHYLALGDAVELRVVGVDRGADRWRLELRPTGADAL